MNLRLLGNLLLAHLTTDLAQGMIPAFHPSVPAHSVAATPVPDRWGPFGRLSVVVVIRSVVYTGLATFLPLLFALATARGPRVATALLVPVAFALYLPFSVLVVMGQEYLLNRVGTASGVTLGLAVTAGGLAAPVLGAVADRWGIGAPLLFVSALPLLAVALALTLPDSRTVAGSSVTPV